MADARLLPAAPIDRVRERPSVQRVVAEALASTRRFEMLPQLVEAREYRDHRLGWMLRSGGVDVVLEGMKRKTILHRDRARVTVDRLASTGWLA